MSPPWIVDDEPDELEIECEPVMARMRMALAEAGYPDAHVFFEVTGIFVEGVDDDALVQRAFDLADRSPA